LQPHVGIPGKQCQEADEFRAGGASTKAKSRQTTLRQAEKALQLTLGNVLRQDSDDARTAAQSGAVFFAAPLRKHLCRGIDLRGMASRASRRGKVIWNGSAAMWLRIPPIVTAQSTAS